MLIANLIGAFLFAFALGRLAVVTPRVHIALGDLAREALEFDGPTTLLHAVFAGWLIALMVWMLPAVKGGRLGIIVLMTNLVGLGGFAHVVAGGHRSVPRRGSWGGGVARGARRLSAAHSDRQHPWRCHAGGRPQPCVGTDGES